MTSAHSSPVTPTKKSWKRRVAKVCVLLAVVFILAITFGLIRLRGFARQVAVQLAELQAQGEPVTLEEWHAYYTQPPESDDVTALLIAAFQELETPEYEASSRVLPLVGEVTDDIPPPDQIWEQLAAARELLDRHVTALEKLHAAADKGDAARFPVGFEHGFLMQFEHAQQLRGAARLLALQSYVKAHERNSQGAADSIHVQLSLARVLLREPAVLAQLTSHACHGMASATIGDLLAHIDFTDEHLNMFQRELRRSELAGGIRRGLIGERAFGVAVYADPEWMGGRPRILRNRDLALFIRLMNHCIEATDRPWPEPLEQMAEAERSCEMTVGSSRFTQIWYPLTLAAFYAPVTASFDAWARTDAMLKVVDAAIAVERYRRNHAQLPEDLDTLVPVYLPVVPVDPFAGKPLRYLLTDGEVVVYSIGRDGIDNGGQGNLSGEPDLAFRLSRR